MIYISFHSLKKRRARNTSGNKARKQTRKRWRLIQDLKASTQIMLIRNITPQIVSEIINPAIKSLSHLSCTALPCFDSILT